MNALLVGWGSEFGQALRDALQKSYTVYTIGSDTQSNLCVDWKTVSQATLEKQLRRLPKMDLIIFNQNGTSLNHADFVTKNSISALWKLEKSWMQTHFTSCILPYHIVNSLDIDNTTVVFVLSSMLYNHELETHMFGLADYSANKYQNYVTMKSFSKWHGKGCFLGVTPVKLNSSNKKTVSEQLVNTLTTAELVNGSVVYFDGTPDLNYRKFEKINE